MKKSVYKEFCQSVVCSNEQTTTQLSITWLNKILLQSNRVVYAAFKNKMWVFLEKKKWKIRPSNSLIS